MKDGDPNTSGTTVLCIIAQKDRIYIANVGDSTVVLGRRSNPDYREPSEPEVIAEVITSDQDKKEKKELKEGYFNPRRTIQP